MYVLIPLNGPFFVFNSLLSFHCCDICCPHLFLVFLKHFILSVLAKHHDSDQFGCSLKFQLAPDGEPQLLCETGKKTPKLKTYEPLKYCWQFYQRCFSDNRCSYLYFFKYLWIYILFRATGNLLLMINVVILLIFMDFNSFSSYSLCSILYNTFLWLGGLQEILRGQLGFYFLNKQTD